MGKVVIGRPFDPGVTMGPVITEAAANRILKIVRDAKSSGAGTVIMGGNRVGGDLAAGFFVEPTMLVDVDNTSAIAQTEIFGPVLCVMPFDDEDEAVALANDTQYGLAAYAHTQGHGTRPSARRLVDRGQRADQQHGSCVALPRCTIRWHEAERIRTSG